MLVVAEVGVATALVIGSGLLLQSFKTISDRSRFPPGSRDLQRPPPVGLYGNWDDVNQYYDALLGELKAFRASRRDHHGHGSPGHRIRSSPALRIMDLPEPLQGEEPQSYLRPVDHDFFEVMGIRIPRAGASTSMDTKDGAAVAVVNEAFVRRHLPDGRASIGHSICTRPPLARWVIS